VSPAPASIAARAAPPARRSWWPLALAGVLLVVAVAIGHTIDVGRYLETARGWTGTLGVLAPGAYVALYVAATLLTACSFDFASFATFRALTGGCPWSPVARVDARLLPHTRTQGLPGIDIAT